MKKKILFNTPSRAVTQMANKVIDKMIITTSEFYPEMILHEDDESVSFKKDEFILRSFFKIGREVFGKVHKGNRGYYLSCEVLNSDGCGRNRLYVYLEETNYSYELHSYIRISTKRSYVSTKIGFFGYVGALGALITLGIAGAFECDQITFIQALQKVAFTIPLTAIAFFLESRINLAQFVEIEKN